MKLDEAITVATHLMNVIVVHNKPVMIGPADRTVEDQQRLVVQQAQALAKLLECARTIDKLANSEG
jgi:hypothetical protein